jgi:hypothetical protein
MACSHACSPHRDPGWEGFELPEMSKDKLSNERQVTVCPECSRFMWKVQDVGKQHCWSCRCSAVIKKQLQERRMLSGKQVSDAEMVQVRTLQHAMQDDDKVHFENADAEMENRQKKLALLRSAQKKASTRECLSESESLAQVQKMKHLECCLRLLDFHRRGLQSFKVTSRHNTANESNALRGPPPHGGKGGSLLQRKRVNFEKSAALSSIHCMCAHGQSDSLM